MSAVSGHYSPRVIGTIFLISFGIYLFLATVTYTPFDPGWMYVSSDTQQVSNASGVVGAWIADILYGLFGWAALLLPIFIFIEAIQVWWPRSYLTPIFRYAAQFFILLTSSALLYFIWQVPSLSMTQAAGGIIGYEVASSLSQILTTPLAVILLALFWFLLWTLAFRIEWMKTGETLAKIPSYLQDLFYKNVPAEAEDFDLSISKPKTHLAAKEKTKEKVQVTQAQEHSPVEFDTDEFDQDFADQLEQELGNQEQANPKKSIVSEPKKLQSVDEDRIIYTGEAWRPKQHDNETVTAPDVEPKQNFKEYVTQPVTHSDTVPASTTHFDVDSQVDDIDKLIAQADSELQGTTTLAKPIQKTPEPSSNSAIDWGDDEFFDDLLAAVPVSKPGVQPEVATSTQLNEEPEKPSALSELEKFLAETEKETAEITPIAKPFTSPEVQTEKASLSKEEFIEAWQENAGKPEDFDWDELDAPLTDASGRPVSRAMQVVEHRKNLSPLPGFDLLDPVDPHKKVNYTAEQLARLSELLELKLQDFNVKAQVIEAHPGPVVTRFELDLAPGVKASKVTNISRDLARSMSMASVRVVEVIPGKPYIGIEVPNSSREMVRLIELLDTPAYRDPNALLSMAMGKDISGNPVLADLAKAPHMLVAGTTGSGKSVAVNSMLLSMLLKYTPKDLRLIMIDPKQLELANYNDIPHLLTPVVTDMKDAVSALNWCVNEMERRYKLMSLLKIRKLADYNRKVAEAIANGEDLIDPTWKPGDSATQERAPRLTELPLIVIVADEFADMIMQVGKKAEEMITRLAQKSRAAGIHLLLATQRPTVDVVTGLIKANIPTRAALRVNSKIDSRTILDAGGAEDLLGHGDMLFLGPGKIEPERVHGAFISDDEVNRICDAWRERGSPNYVDEILTPYDEEPSSASGDYEAGDGADRDMLYDQCVAFVLETRKASASSLQRKFSLGYNRAARIIDQMEENGIVSPLGANGKRDIIV